MSHVSCFSILMTLSFLAFAESTGEGPVVGAIRWDAWHGPASEVGLIVEKTLSPKHYHYRIPFFGSVTGENAVEARGNRQGIPRYRKGAGGLNLCLERIR